MAKIHLDEVPHFTMPQIEDLRQLHQKVQLDPEVLSTDEIIHLHPVTEPAHEIVLRLG